MGFFGAESHVNVDLSSSILNNANLTGANLKNAYLDGTVDLDSATVNATTIYNQWTVFPTGFDPVASGLRLVMSPAGT